MLGFAVAPLCVEEFPGPLFALDPEALRAVARYHSNMAKMARALAKERDARHRASFKFRRQLRDAPFGAGLGTLAVEIGDQAAAAKYATVKSTATLHRKTVERQERKARREERNRMVMQLASRGWKNVRIGKRLHIHANTVSRIIQGALRPRK